MRAQVEIMGLMIIVIMISLLLFFGMVFLLDSGEPTRPAESEFANLQLIDNFPTSIFQSHSNCSRAGGYYTLGEVLDFCVTRSVSCEDSCELFNKSVELFLNSTFDVYGLDYYFNVSSGGNTISYFNKNNCKSIARDGFSTPPFPRNIPSGRRTEFTRSILIIKVCP